MTLTVQDRTTIAALVREELRRSDLGSLVRQLQGIPGWSSGALAGTWANVAGEEAAGWRTFPTGRTEVRGAVTGGGGPTVFTITDPAARPATIVRRSGIGRVGGTTGPVEVTVSPAGVVSVLSPLAFPAAGDYYSIACSFPAVG